MRRQLPAGLTNHQRALLSEFFAGHISAGELTQRLHHPAARSDKPPAAQNTAPVAVGAGSAEVSTKAFPSQTDAATRWPHQRRRRLAWLIPLIAAALSGGAIGAGLGSTRQVAAVHRAGHQRLRHRALVTRRKHVQRAGAALPSTPTAPPSSPSAPTASAGDGSSAPTASTTARTNPATSTSTSPRARSISTLSTASTAAPTSSTPSATTAPATAPATRSNSTTSTTPTTSTTG